MATTSLWHIEGRLKTARRILHELTPEEMEEAFQQHLTERNKEKRGCRTNVRQLILYIQHKTPSFEKPGVRGIISLCD